MDDSIRAAAAVGPKTAMPASRERVGEPGGQRRLGADHDELDRERARASDDGAASSGVESAATTGRAGSSADPVAARRDDDLVDARLGGELPGERVLAAAAADDRGSGSAWRSGVMRGRLARRRIGPPGPLDRLGPLRPDRDEDDRHAGVLLERGHVAAGVLGQVGERPDVVDRLGPARELLVDRRRARQRRAAATASLDPPAVDS